MGSLISILLQVYCRVYWWKNFENRSMSDAAITKTWGCFFAHSVYYDLSVCCRDWWLDWPYFLAAMNVDNSVWILTPVAGGGAGVQFLHVTISVSPQGGNSLPPQVRAVEKFSSKIQNSGLKILHFGVI